MSLKANTKVVIVEEGTNIGMTGMLDKPNLKEGCALEKPKVLNDVE